MLFEYPKSSHFGKIVAKNKIYEHSKPSTKLKNLFVEEVEQIIWKNKLAPETINVPSTKSVPEIQVFNLHLKNGKINHEVLSCIDKAIAFPIIFEAGYQDKCKMIACYKRKNEADNSKWVISSYFETNWQNKETERKKLPITLNMESLYQELLEPLLPYKAREKERLPQHIERIESILSKQQEILKKESLLAKEKQFNRKVEINADLRNLKKELESLEI